METTCVHYSRDYVGNPCITAIDRDRCAVADGTGHVTTVNLRSQQVGPKLFVGTVGGTSSNLRSLRPDPARPEVVAVATRGAYAAVGDLGRQMVSKIHPVHGGTVQAVAISPDGRWLAIGTGAYSASGPPQSARVEVWSLSIEDGTRYVGFAAMPGVCVESVAWSPDGTLIACAAGLRSQNAGFIAQLDAADLRARSFFETTGTGATRLGYLDGDSTCSHLAVVSKGGFRVLNAADGQEVWRIDRPDSPDVVMDFDLVPQERQVVLNSGRVLDALDGSERTRFLAMNDCTSIAARPGGGYIGVSSRGRIYCWD